MAFLIANDVAVCVSGETETAERDALVNADVFTNPIVNYSRAVRRRIDLDVGVAYDSDIEKVRHTVQEAILEVEGLLEEPAPNVVFHTFADSSIDFTVYYWIDTNLSDPFKSKDQGLAAVKLAFERAGIEIPYPIRSVHLQQ